MMGLVHFAASIGHYRQQEGAERIEFVDASDVLAEIGAGVSRREALKRFHVRLPSGELKSGAAAFVEIWKLLPRWRFAAKLARLPGMTLALDMGYRVASPFRPALARAIGRL